MNDFKDRFIHLLHCRGVGWKIVYEILKIDPELRNIYNTSMIPLLSHLSPLSYHSLLADLHSHSISEQIRQYRLNGIGVITIFDPEYPSILKETYQPPWILYSKGKIDLLNKQPKLAVVGSRQATEYGRKAINHLFPKLIENGVAIVSGLATGIDTISHQSAIMYGGNTIGVIAGGFYHIYPKENKELALDMMKNQLVISEYPPDTKPSRWQFPMRNRIISGMSFGTFIIEAKRKSGSLITANFALNEGREVFALPGSIFSPYSVGPNDLILQGAKPVNSYRDILEELVY